MSTPSPAASTRPFCPTVWLLPHLTPFNLTVAAVLGAATAGFGALVAVLLLISTNFNILSLIE